MHHNNNTKIKREDIKTVLPCSYNACDWHLKMPCDQLKVNFKKVIDTITNKRNRLKANNEIKRLVEIIKIKRERRKTMWDKQQYRF